MKRIVAWNIRHGGGAGDRQRCVIDTLLGFAADILILTEFRVGPSGAALIAALENAGYHTSHPPAQPSKNTVLVACKSAILGAIPLDALDVDNRHLWRVELGWLSIVGVYMPVGIAKLPYWESVIRAAAAQDAPELFIGDFNTGTNTLDKDPRGERYFGPEYMEKMASQGFVDLWRHRYPNDREYTWFSPQGKNGFRLDHAFGSSRLNAMVVGCRYDHDPRLAGVSDHSALHVEVDWKVQPPRLPRAAITGSSIYVLEDPGCPGLVKIGKDQRWPRRLRQAQSHTPRGMREVARWHLGSVARAELTAAERQVLMLFERETSGRERVRATPEAARAKISAILGAPMPATATDGLVPYDDWRDWPRPHRSPAPRRIWLGVEINTGRIKVVHSIHVDLFDRFCPTYSCHGINWGEAWQWPEGAWSASSSLHPLDERMISVWTDLVETHGYGFRDGRVGWLREEASLKTTREGLRAAGMVMSTLSAGRRGNPSLRGSTPSETHDSHESGLRR